MYPFEMKEPEVDPALLKAKQVADKYKELSGCVKVAYDTKAFEQAGGPIDHYGHNRGWWFSAYELKEAGISLDDVYKYIRKLAEERKSKLESELKHI